MGALRCSAGRQRNGVNQFYFYVKGFHGRGSIGAESGGDYKQKYPASGQLRGAVITNMVFQQGRDDNDQFRQY